MRIDKVDKEESWKKRQLRCQGKTSQWNRKKSILSRVIYTCRQIGNVDKEIHMKRYQETLSRKNYEISINN